MMTLIDRMVGHLGDRRRWRYVTHLGPTTKGDGYSDGQWIRAEAGAGAGGTAS